jgi:hypothetical protein
MNSSAYTDDARDKDDKLLGFEANTFINFLLFWMIVQTIISIELLTRGHVPGYFMYLLIHSILPLFALIAVKVKDGSSMRWVLLVAYTVTK